MREKSPANVSEADLVFTAPWYPWYVNDVLTSEQVDCLSLAEEGAYRRALDKAWKKGSVPTEPSKLALLIGKRCSIKIAKVVLTLFDPHPDYPSRSINLKLEKVRFEQKAKYDQQATKGKKGAESRWHSYSTGNAQAMPGDSHSDSDSDTDTELREELREEVRASPAKRGCRLPTDFAATEPMFAWAKENCPNVAVTIETEKFKDHWASAVKNAVKIDWVAAWRLWMRNAQDWNPKGNNQNGKQHALSAREQRAIDDHNTISRVRERVEARDRELSRQNAADRK